MIWQPENQAVRINYGDKTQSNLFIPKNEMPCQGLMGTVVAASRGPGPHNTLIALDNELDLIIFEVIPKGNLNEI